MTIGTETPGLDTAHARLMRAALILATDVSTEDRMAIDPAMPGDRSPLADRLRAQMRAEHIAEFRAAQAEFDRRMP